MARIDINFNVDALTRSLKGMQKQIPFAISVALNKTVQEGRKVAQTQVDKDYEGGSVPFTRTAILYKNSKKQDLRAYIFVHKDAKYILVTADRGTRTLTKDSKKAMVSPVPDGKYKAGVRRTKQGNVPHLLAKKLLGETATSFSGPRAGSKSKSSSTGQALKYFSGVPKGNRWGGNREKYAGIWMRIGRAKDGRRAALKMVLKYDVDTKRPRSTEVIPVLKDFAHAQVPRHLFAVIQKILKEFDLQP